MIFFPATFTFTLNLKRIIHTLSIYYFIKVPRIHVNVLTLLAFHFFLSKQPQLDAILQQTSQLSLISDTEENLN